MSIQYAQCTEVSHVSYLTSTVEHTIIFIHTNYIKQQTYPWFGMVDMLVDMLVAFISQSSLVTEAVVSLGTLTNSCIYLLPTVFMLCFMYSTHSSALTYTHIYTHCKSSV